MWLWLIPMPYLGESALCGVTFPRIERSYMSSLAPDMSVTPAQEVFLGHSLGHRPDAPQARQSHLNDPTDPGLKRDEGSQRSLQAQRSTLFLGG
jgi:hypothetical protein